MTKRTVICFLAMILVVGGGLTWGKSKKNTIVGLDELIEQDGSFKITMIHPDADFARYSKLLAGEIDFEFRGDGTRDLNRSTGSIMSKSSAGPPKPKRKDMAKFKQIIEDALVEELGRDEPFDMVHEPDAGTLILRVTVQDMVSSLPSKGIRRADSKVQIGVEGLLVFDLIDAETGVIQARIGERRRSWRVANSAKEAEPSEMWIEVDEWAHRAAADLSQELERVRTTG